MLFDLALPAEPVRTDWSAVELANDQDEMNPAEKAIYDKLCAKGVPAAVARGMARKAAAKKDAATETTRQAGVSLAVPTNLRAAARREAADKGQAMPDGS